MSTERSVEEIAKEVRLALREACIEPDDIIGQYDGSMERKAEQIIAAALRAERERHNQRPVCGRTADGVEVRMGDPVWFRRHLSNREPELWHASLGGSAIRSKGWSDLLDSWFYSTRAAAEAAAAKEVQGE